MELLLKENIQWVIVAALVIAFLQVCNISFNKIKHAVQQILTTVVGSNRSVYSVLFTILSDSNVYSTCLGTSNATNMFYLDIYCEDSAPGLHKTLVLPWQLNG